MSYELGERQKIGLGLIGFGIFFSFLAILLFFDRGLLALGNIFWLTGVALLLGWRSTLQLFTNRMNYKGSISFLLGLFFIFVRWPVVGILVEMYGCIILFGGFWPSIKGFLYQIPVFGWILRYPVLGNIEVQSRKICMDNLGTVVKSILTMKGREIGSNCCPFIPLYHCSCWTAFLQHISFLCLCT